MINTLINIGSFQNCVCQQMFSSHPICLNEHGFSEQGKKVKFCPKSDETVMAVVLDGCVFTDNQPKCDGLFLYAAKNRKLAVLVELKGAGDIPRAFKQIAYVRASRPEYRVLLDCLNQVSGPKAIEKAFIVSNGFLTKPQKEKLENLHGIRVEAVLHCEASSQVPDLRQYV